MKICYKEQQFYSRQLSIIGAANSILEEYASQGFVLTLRQLYYQFVARDLIPNTERSYRNLGATISNARIAGLIDWEHLVDRTRNLRSRPRWGSPADILEAAVASFHVDYWEGQSYRPEIWIEKDALVDIASKAGELFDVPVFSCRGYGSQSELWAASRRMIRHARAGYKPVIFHLGDHDPSGMDMTRDIIDRLELFEADVDIRRIALNMDQIEAYKPPPNPAKTTDSRFAWYQHKYGTDSWELDALEPSVIVDLLKGSIRSLIEPDKWARTVEVEETGRESLSVLSANYDNVTEIIEMNDFYSKYGDPSALGQPSDYC